MRVLRFHIARSDSTCAKPSLSYTVTVTRRCVAIYVHANCFEKIACNFLDGSVSAHTLVMTLVS